MKTAGSFVALTGHPHAMESLSTLVLRWPFKGAMVDSSAGDGSLAWFARESRTVVVPAAFRVGSSCSKISLWTLDVAFYWLETSVWASSTPMVRFFTCFRSAHCMLGLRNHLSPTELPSYM